MSRKHPVISITGSSGAGTTTVTTTFAQIFRREGINAAILEGDSFHRYNRAEMRALIREAGERGQAHVSHFGPEANLFEELEELFRSYGETGTGKVRKYLHNDDEAAPYGQPPGTFTPWEDIEPGTDMLFYEGLHGGVVHGNVQHRRVMPTCWWGWCRSSTWSGSRSCTGTRRPAAIRRKRWWTRSCGGCRTT